MQLHSDHGASNSHRRPSNETQQYWRSLQHRSNTSSLGERPRNASQRKEIPATLKGGGDPDASSSQQQDITSKDLLSLANDASSLRLQWEALRLRDDTLDPNISITDLWQRKEKLEKDVLANTDERARLDNQ